MRYFLYVGIGIGTVIGLFALIDIVRVEMMHPEKRAYYVMGHWIDAFWQLQLPALIIGLVKVAGCLQLMNHVRR